MNQRQVCSEKKYCGKRHSIYALNDKKNNKSEVMFLGSTQKI